MDTIVRLATLNDWKYIEMLSKKESDALGFIPKQTYLSIIKEIPDINKKRRWQYSEVLIAEDNGDLTGFSYTSYSQEMSKIHQICIQEDARRWYRASLLLGEIEREGIRRKRKGIIARVAVDLEANFFWRALGYFPLKVSQSTYLNRHPSKSGREVITYIKYFEQEDVEQNLMMLLGLDLLG